jgi:hypothetical protein
MSGSLVALVLALAVPTAASAAAYEADPTGYARGAIVPPDLTPPSSFAPIGLVDDVVDAKVADVSQVKVLKNSPGKVLNLRSEDPVEHGTEVASVAAGRADGKGVLGIAPGAPLLSWGYKTMECAEIAEGILALADAGAKVINLSFESIRDENDPDDDGRCQRMELAIAAAYGSGALVVASAGNSRKEGDPVEYPGAYPHVLTVGATGLDDRPDPESSTGRGLDLVAPGEAIPVALPAALDRDGTADGLTRQDGTSFAAPMVSGVASWLIAARPKLAPSQYADLLRATATDVGAAGWDARTGFGSVDLAAALTAPVPQADRSEPNDVRAEVDGTVFDTPDRPISGTVKATIAPYEDPADVYRVRVKARSTKTITLTTAARGVSLKGAGGKRTLRLRNRTGAARTSYVTVQASGARVATSLAYALKVR